MRLGLHVQDNQSLDLAVDYCARVKPAVMKWLSPEADIIRRCRTVSPGTKHIARVVFSPQNNDSYKDFVARTLDRANVFGRLIDYHEGYNEHIPNEASVGDIRDFARLEVGLAKKLNEKGIGALIGGFSTGTLDGGKIDGFKLAFEYMQSVGPERCALHFHEYAGGYVGHFVKTPDGLNQWPDGGSWSGHSKDANIWWDPKLRGWLLLRYRDLHPQLLARGWDKVRFFITESGLDSVNKNPAGKKGFRDYTGTEWSQVPGLGDYAQQMRWYAWQMTHDPYVWGAVDYGFGTRDHAWDSFDLTQDRDMLERFIIAQATLPVGHIGTPIDTPIDPIDPIVVPPPTDDLHTVLKAAFGNAYEDLRTSLPTNPSGPNGPFLTRPLAGVRWIAVHHSAGPKDQTWKVIADDHIRPVAEGGRLGAAGIGYHVGIRRGKAAYLGDWAAGRANVKNQNHLVIGVCVSGDYTQESLDAADLDALRKVVKAIDKAIGRKLDIAGHGQLPGQATACPGGALAAEIPTLREAVDEGGGPGGGPGAGTADLDAALVAAGLAAREIRLNHGAALQQAIARDGFAPTSNEFEITHDGERYVAQLTENLGSGAMRVYYARVPDWADVRFVERG